MSPKYVELTHPKTGHRYTCHLAQVEMWLKRGWERVTDAAPEAPAAKPAKKTPTTTPAVPADAPKEG